MPDPSHRPYEPMTIIRPHTMPRLWWLFPWSYARTLHTAANALRALCDRQDELLKDKVSARPRWSIWTKLSADGVVEYYFMDTDPDILEGYFFRKRLLYDDDSKSFVKRIDAADAIAFCERLNRGEVK